MPKMRSQPDEHTTACASDRQRITAARGGQRHRLRGRGWGAGGVRGSRIGSWCSSSTRQRLVTVGMREIVNGGGDGMLHSSVAHPTDRSMRLPCPGAHNVDENTEIDRSGMRDRGDEIQGPRGSDERCRRGAACQESDEMHGKNARFIR